MSVLSSSSIGAASPLLASSSSGPLAVSGLISGIDTSKVIQGLLAIEQQKITVIDAKKSKLQLEQTAFKGIEARLLALQGQMTQLSRSQNGVFDARIVQSSDSEIVTAAASRTAVPGVYHFRVNSLAKAQQIASQGFDTLASLVTQGSLQIKVGDASTSITVDSNNNTLQGLADTINASGAAVTASVINDGSGDGQQGYRLMLVAKATGVANGITVTNSLAGTGSGATKPLFDVASIGNVVQSAGNTGTAPIVSNAGPGYTGDSNNLYTFTVVQGGTVGTDNGIQLSYTDTTGANTGTITINQADVDVFKSAAQGIGVTFSAGTLVAGNKFTVKAFVPTIQDAADASVTLGSGAGALTITSSSNQVDSIIPGVTLQLQGSDPSKDVALTVANDTDKIKKSIQDYIAAFNDSMTYIDQQISYDSDTGQAAPLLGNRQAITIQEQIRTAVVDVVKGVNPQMNFIGALGISTDDNGHLLIDDAKLSAVLNGSRSGVTLEDVRKLFALAGASTNPGVQFVTGSTKTVASPTPYTVQITQAAEKASLTGPNSLAASTVIDGTNNSVIVNVDGATSAALTLASGTYTRLALAQALQSAINSDATLLGRQVAVGLTADKLTILSNAIGSISKITMQSGSALASLGFVGGENAQGKDVAGSFLANGAPESATGTGQFLLGNSANANTADLQVRVTLTSAQVGAGISADLTVSRGVASRLDSVLTSVFDPVSGRLKTIDDGFQASIDQLDGQRTKQTEIMLTRQDQLARQFASMERTLAQLQSTSNFLSLQMASLNKDK